ncbi:hypothetical protein [Furfurilactobacillus siliginis]|nr:hypothetical protein [Furfurilactobacillus siliginis]GEK28009.1 hypothetical protein LSI01_03200 [Furfurilactobacillus siliginis]
MTRKARVLTIVVWVLMAVCVGTLSLRPAEHYVTAQNIGGWWLTLVVYSVAFALGWWQRAHQFGKFVLAITVALAVLFGLFILLVALFAENGLTRSLLGGLALLEIIAGIMWYATVFERRNRLANRKIDD